MPRTKRSVPLPLLLKESSIISIIILPGFPTALLLTVLLPGHLVQLAACKSSFLPSAGRCRVWPAGCSARIHFYEFLQRQIPLCRQSPVPAFKQTSASEGDVESIVAWEKPCPKEAQGSGWLQEELVALLLPGGHWPRGMPAWTIPAAAQMLPWRASRAAELHGATAAKNLPPLAAGREVGFETATSARRVHTLHKVLPPGHGCGAQQSPSPAGCCIWQRAAPLACVAFRVLTLDPIAKQYSSQHFLLPCYSDAFHYSPCRTLTLLNLSTFLQFVSQTPCYTLIPSLSIFAYLPWLEWYLNRGLLLKAWTDLHVWLCQELLMKIPTSMGE